MNGKIRGTHLPKTGSEYAQAFAYETGDTEVTCCICLQIGLSRDGAIRGKFVLSLLKHGLFQLSCLNDLICGKP